MAKEGTLSGNVTYAGTHKIIPLDKERFVMVYEIMNKASQISIENDSFPKSYINLFICEKPDENISMRTNYVGSYKLKYR